MLRQAGLRAVIYRRNGHTIYK